MLLLYLTSVCFRLTFTAIIPYRNNIEITFSDYFQTEGEESMEKLYCDKQNSASSITLMEHPRIKEGDMLMENDYEEDHTRLKRNVLSSFRRLWPGGIVYFQFDRSLTIRDRKHMLSAMEMISSVSCIQFYYKTNDISHYLHIKSGGSRCWSHVGFFGWKRHDIVLGDRCWNDRTIMHELFHSLGFGHEHNRPDRDNHITINWENIKEDKRIQFCKNQDGVFKIFDLSYDHHSIMHYYGFGSFAINTQSPILFSKNGNVRLGGNYLTAFDVCKLNLLYNCGSYSCPIYA